MNSLQEWIRHIFDHPVGKPDWWWSDDAPEWQGSREEVPVLVAATFERSRELLAPFSDEQLAQGFWYLVGDSSPADFMQTLVDQETTPESRLRALESFVPFFEQVVTVRCPSQLSGPDDGGAYPLHIVCFMWWDLLRRTLWYKYPQNDPPAGRECAGSQTEIIDILRRILALPHDACRLSALHGIGHLYGDCPQSRDALTVIIDDFLATVPDWRPKLVAYAVQARGGTVL